MPYLSSAVVRRTLPTPHLPRPAWLTRTSPTTVGYLLIVLAFAGSGVGSVIAKAAYTAGATPIGFVSVRLLTAVGVLVALAGPAMLHLPRRRILELVGLGVAFGLQTLSYYLALGLSPVAMVVVIVSSYPIAVIVMDAVDERAVPSRSHLLAMGGALLGLWLAAGSPLGGIDTGMVLALASAGGYALYLRLSSRALGARTNPPSPQVPPLVATAWMLSGALLLILSVAAVTGHGLPTGIGAVSGVVHGVVSTTIPITAIYAALQRLSTGQVAALGPLEPILATGVAAAALGETLGPLEGLGVAVVVAATAKLSGIRPRAGLPRLPFAVPRPPRPRRWIAVPRPPGIRRRPTAASTAAAAAPATPAPARRRVAVPVPPQAARAIRAAAGHAAPHRVPVPRPPSRTARPEAAVRPPRPAGTPSSVPRPPRRRGATPRRGVRH